MKFSASVKCGLTLAACLFVDRTCGQDIKLELWKGNPPGKIAATGPEVDITDDNDKSRYVAGERVMRLGQISIPMVTLFQPTAESNTGTAVLVCPGGGYSILAYDLEGTEVCNWLQSIGVTGVLLKYRVPKPNGETRPIEPLQDAQRAMSMIRSNAERWGINPERVGVLGFSAGGHLSARLSTNYQTRSYDAQDSIDELSCRPDFAVLVYPAYLFDKGSDRWLSEQLPVDEHTPPMFLTMAFDDRVGPENILRMGLALKEHDVPAEVHLYPTGGHGYGLRRSSHEATSWPSRCEEWMRASGWLAK
ncbi:MAG: alpha/beta hydrolase [Planctomycetales bacterium]|nr:alpha/beta hydrolase [Planctomycetales bacterium]